MKFSRFNRLSAGAVAALGAVLLSACDAAPTGGAAGSGDEYSAVLADPILADPVAGDLWAAKLDEFSNADFGMGTEQGADAYGLMKVISVSEDRVVVITENAAWPVPSETVNELRGDLAAIVWDESEEIPINRSDLQSLVDSEYILETRRLEE
ncbi:hypothetical protein [uncultured Erythrobacter sp.]|uniref:hypothetical protein n=1 Tax=uncultured Erythrobacter sp. TaxID=263913 RepID=UPI00261F054D|nr:hypothetical protein [uncultured Erythrobacter sp.]